VDLLYGPTYGNTIILNKNKIQDCVGRHLGFCTGSSNLAADWDSLMQFCRNVASHYWK